MTAPPRGALANCRVLVAEDEYFIARDIARALHALEAEVVGPVPSRDAVQAILATGERIDAAILDINLNGETVFPVMDALAARASLLCSLPGMTRPPCQRSTGTSHAGRSHLILGPWCGPCLTSCETHRPEPTPTREGLHRIRVRCSVNQSKLCPLLVSGSSVNFRPVPAEAIRCAADVSFRNAETDPLESELEPMRGHGPAWTCCRGCPPVT